MSHFVIGNIFLVLSILATSIGQVLIKEIYVSVPAEITTSELLRFILTTYRIWCAGLAGSLIVVGFMFWVLCLHKLPLSYAYPIACSSALVVALFCVLFLGETVTWQLWVGILLIALGSALVVVQQ